MSDVKSVGIIGQAYEDRTTGKVGILESRDDKCKTLMLIGDDGKGFNVSYSSFRSKWRKRVDEQEEVKDEVKEVIKNEPKVTKETLETVTDDNGCYHVNVQGLEVLYIKPYKDGTYFVSCFPDIYTDSVDLRPYTSNFKCARTKTGLDISFKVAKMEFEQLKGLLHDAVTNINMYGYVEE